MNPILDQLEGLKVRCTKAISGKGIEVGDRCVKTETHYVPLIRLYSESTIETLPMNPIAIVDTNEFEFIEE